MKNNTKKIVHGEKNGPPRDSIFEGIMGDILIAQFQADILRSRLSDRVGGWWSLSQDKNRTSSCFSYEYRGKVFKVSMAVNEVNPS